MMSPDESDRQCLVFFDFTAPTVLTQKPTVPTTVPTVPTQKQYFAVSTVPRTVPMYPSPTGSMWK